MCEHDWNEPCPACRYEEGVKRGRKDILSEVVPLVREVVFASQYLDRTQLLIAVRDLSLKVDPANKGIPTVQKYSTVS